MIRALAMQRVLSSAGVLPKLARLRADERRSRAELDRLRDDALTELLSHARAHIPHYRRTIPSSVLSTSGRVCADELQQIPLLDRATLREQFDALTADNAHLQSTCISKSGGSTGEPVAVLHDEEFASWVRAIKVRDDEWLGYRQGEAKILLWGSERDLFYGAEDHRTRLARWVRNEIWLNAFRMSEEAMLGYIDIIARVRPAMLLAYTESLYELARFALRNGRRIGVQRGVMTSAGTLFPHMRATIEEACGAPVFNRYGSREVGDAACECERHDGLHIVEPAYFVEIVNAEGTRLREGEVGEIAITTLRNYAMPLIRYRIGDMGSMRSEPCGCGRTWVRLGDVAGRVTDVLRTANGGVVVPEYLIHLIGVVLNRGWVRKYQIVQTSLNDVTVRIARFGGDADEHAADVAEMAERIRLVFGAGCVVHIDWVDDIPASPSGKYRYTICDLSAAGSLTPAQPGTR